MVEITAIPLVREQVAGTTYTFVPADNGKFKEFTSATAVTVTIPNSLTADWYTAWGQAGAGQLTFVAASGATLRNRSSHTKSAGQYAEGGLRCRANAGGAAAEVVLTGDTST